MTDQKHTKKVLASSPNMYGKNFQSLNESIAYANEGKIVLCASTTGLAIMISREKYNDICRQRDELREALSKLLDEYVRGANSGDWGNWNPEEEPEVILARSILRKTKDTK